MRNMVFRGPIKLPHKTFAEAVSFDELTMENTQLGTVLIITGERFEQETGTATITFDAIKPDGTEIKGIKFLKRQEEVCRYDEVESDEIKIEDCPQYREYAIRGRMLAKTGANKIRVNISAVEGSQTNCCVFVEARSLRYTSEMPWTD